MVMDHGAEHASRCAAIVSIAAKCGCSALMLHNWVAQAERDAGARACLSTGERERVEARGRRTALCAGDHTLIKLRYSRMRLPCLASGPTSLSKVLAVSLGDVACGFPISSAVIEEIRYRSAVQGSISL